jgi:hypothetical protein
MHCLGPVTEMVYLYFWYKIWIIKALLSFFLLVLGIKPKVSLHVQCTSTTKLHPSPGLYLLRFFHKGSFKHKKCYSLFYLK